MYIKKCPKCGRLPIITELSLKFRPNTRTHIIRCPNYCSVVKPLEEIDNDLVLKNKYHNLCFLKGYYLIIVGNVDDNTIYKIWNEALID